MVKLTIDSQSVEVPDGTTVLRAAEQAGIRIPTLCAQKELEPYGGCRLCLVEVEGARTLQPSCTLPAGNNMVVRTNTPKVHEARKFVLTLLFSERNHFCPFCQVSGGDCDLQNAALDEGMTHWPLSPNYQPFAVDASHQYFVLDNNRCILCRRCVRACGELVGNYTLGFEERGARSFLVADFGVPLGTSTCVSCGTCTQVCPTGALIDKMSAYRGKVVQAEHNKTVCVGCSVGCGIDVLTRDNNLVRIEGDWDAPVNSGVICKQGRFVSAEDNNTRIVTPMVRKEGVLKAATWDEALDLVAAHLKPLSGHKSDGIAAIASTRLPAEALSLFKDIFGNQLGSDLVTSTEEGFTTAVPAALATELGKSFEGSLPVLQNADVVVSIGTNLIDNHQVAGFLVKRAIPQGTKVVLVDASQNPLNQFAEITLKPVQTDDINFLEGLCAAVAQLGLAKKSMPVTGTLEALAAKAGVSAEDLLKTANLVASAKRPAIVYGKGITASGNPLALKTLVKFAEMVGAITETESRLINLKGEANSLAAALYGLDKPFNLNGHQAVYLALGDMLPSPRLVKKLEKAPYLVVESAYSSQLTAQADVVLPSAKWTEEEGHFLSFDGKLQMSAKVLNGPAESWPNATILASLAQRLGASAASDWKEMLTQRVSPVAITA